MRFLALALVLSSPAFAQITPEREIETVKFIFNAGNYALARQRVQEALKLGNFTEHQRIEMLKYGGLSAFNLGETKAAEEDFLALLKLNPDYVLDPFAVPPPAIKLFDEVKKKNADALNMIRQQIAIREEQARREAAEAERRKKLEDDERKRLEELSRNVQVKVIEKRSLIPNFVPFGVGQFLQGRTEWGVVFALVEAVLGATSLIGYIAIETLYEDVKLERRDVLYGGDSTGTYTFTIHTIPAERAGDHRAWNFVKLSTGIAFYAVAALGIFDALWHHKSEVVSFQTQRPQDVITPSKNEGPKPMFNLYPLPGGAGFEMSLKF